MPDPRTLLPRDKLDISGAHAVISLGYPAVAPVLPDLLTWLQDGNWPVCHPISEFLATLPEPMAPLIAGVLSGRDLVWKYWCIRLLITQMPASVAAQFRPELMRLAQRPTPEEQTEGLDDVARDAL